MRPSALDPLFAPASALAGIGPKNAKLFNRLLDKPQGARVVDILFHLPQATVDRRARPKIRDAVPGTIVTIEAKVTEHRGPPNARSRAPFKVLVEDDTGDVELVFFLANHEWVRSRLPIGATRWISGKLELWDGRRQMVHPDRVMNAEELDRLPSVEPVYGLTEGLYQRGVAHAAEGALKRLPPMPEWISAKTLSDLKLPSFSQALVAMHRPETPEDVDPASAAATRLAYDELLANQLALLLMRARMRVIPGRAHKAEGALARRLEAALPFSLTRAQRQAIEDIRADLRAEKRMLRLLQGDVGSGKTVVALMAMAEVVEAGRQAAMMAPTEILARQHYERMAPLAATAGLRIALLTGRDKAAARRASLAALAEGTI
ncbi:MAG: DEAD/DEAH box helicase, partial [Hyphomicrobiales bacterium]|nr:DEAD/DEAH box helicase [Hyphomicrobiales bacterium]